MKDKLYPANIKSIIPIGVTNDAAIRHGLLPYISITLVINILPIEKLIKLIAPISPILYGSSQMRFKRVIQL